jgi:hypothetical protein
MRADRFTANKDWERSEACYWTIQEERANLFRLIDRIVEWCKERPRQYHNLRTVLKALGETWNARTEEMVCRDGRLWNMPLNPLVWTGEGLHQSGLQPTAVCWNHTQTRAEKERHNLMAMAITRKV